MNPIEVFGRATKASLSDFGQCFLTFSNTAFRFECLPEYRVSSEVPAIDRYRSGRSRPEDFNSDWSEILVSAKKRDAVIERVRLLPVPMTEYFKFEYAWGYKYNSALGEKIGIINPSETDITSKLGIFLDFWLFDSKKVFLMSYDYIGRFLGVLECHSSDVAKFAEIAGELRLLAKPLSLYASISDS